MSIQITVSNDKKRSLSNAWKKCIGTGRLGLALRKEYLDALKQVQQDIGFEYIRGHGLFSDDVGIYREFEWDGQTHVHYNFHYIDQIFDSFLEIGIKPFIELGFMPEDLASGEQTVFWWKGNVTPPKDYTKWSDLVKQTINHFIERYGLEEVLTWPIEVWNEPNLQHFWQDANQEEYFKLYKETVKVIKKIDSRLQVGGPAIAGGTDYWLKDFLEFCSKENVPVDFLSRHAYSSHPAELIPFSVYQGLDPNDNLLKDFKTGKDYLSDSDFKNETPVHITEFNSSYKPVNPIHDTAYNAVYLAKVLAQGGKFTDSFSYWTFSDVFEEEDIPKSLLHGGFGLMAYHCLKKPTYYLYEFFNKLGEDVLYEQDGVLVTKRKDQSLSILMWDEPHPNAKYEKDFEFILTVESKKVVMKQSKVNEEVGNIWCSWKKLGRPRYPSKDEIELIREASLPEVSLVNLESKNKQVTLSGRITKNELSLVEIFPVKEERQPYIGLDDTRIISYENERD